jgi:hypothetical protein
MKCAPLDARYGAATLAIRPAQTPGARADGGSRDLVTIRGVARVGNRVFLQTDQRSLLRARSVNRTGFSVFLGCRDGGSSPELRIDWRALVVNDLVIAGILRGR